MNKLGISDAKIENNTITLGEQSIAPVVSVNEKSGAVSLIAEDVHALPDTTVIPKIYIKSWTATNN